MSKNPKISVIVPTYKQQDLVVETLSSIANQTYSNIEIIVINDCSPDNTDFVIKNWLYENRHVEVNYIKNIKNEGLHAAFNKGISEAKGEFIQLLAGDDIILPNKFEVQVKIFESDPKIDYIYSNHYIFNNEKKILCDDYLAKQYPINEELPKGNIFGSIMKSMFYSNIGLLCKRHVFEEPGFKFDPEIITEDLHFQLYLGLFHNGLGIRDILAGYRYNFNGNSMTNSILEDNSYKITLIKSRIKLLTNFKNAKMPSEDERIWLNRIIFNYHFAKRNNLNKEILDELSNILISRKVGSFKLLLTSILSKYEHRLIYKVTDLLV